MIDRALQPTAAPILKHISDEVDAGSPQKMRPTKNSDRARISRLGVIWSLNVR
jgi:hypothetical protein